MSLGTYNLHLYGTTAAHDADYDNDSVYAEPWVALTTQTNKVTYNKKGIEMSLSALLDATNYCDDCCDTTITLNTQDNTLSAFRRTEFGWAGTDIVPEGTPADINNGDLTLDEETFGDKWRLYFNPDITAQTPNEPTWPITSVNGNTIANMEKVYVDPGYAMGRIYVTTHYYVTRDGDTYNVSYYDEKKKQDLH